MAVWQTLPLSWTNRTTGDRNCRYRSSVDHMAIRQHQGSHIGLSWRVAGPAPDRLMDPLTCDARSRARHVPSRQVNVTKNYNGKLGGGKSLCHSTIHRIHRDVPKYDVMNDYVGGGWPAGVGRRRRHCWSRNRQLRQTNLLKRRRSGSLSHSNEGVIDIIVSHELVSTLSSGSGEGPSIFSMNAASRCQSPVAGSARFIEILRRSSSC